MSFFSFLSLCLTNKKWEITKEVSLNFNGYYSLCHTNGQMCVNMIISLPTIKIINEHNFIAVYWYKSQTTTHGDFILDLYVFLGRYLPIHPPLKSISCIWYLLDRLSHQLVCSRKVWWRECLVEGKFGKFTLLNSGRKKSGKLID